jgi:hypothetical protein
VAALLAGAVLVAIAACKPKPWVWAVELVQAETPTDDGRQVTVRFAAYATVCLPEAHDSLDSRGGGYGHKGCLSYGSEELAATDRFPPELRVGELTATAHVQIVAMYKSQLVEPLYEGDIGPLAMGQKVVLGPVTWAYGDVETSGADVPKPYAVYAKISDCRLSNGSACGNNSLRHSFDRPGRSAGGLEAAGARLDVPDRAGGLDRVELRSGSGAERPGQPESPQSLAGVPVRRTVFGLYRLGSGPGGAPFWGAEFAEAQPPSVVDRTGEHVILAAFDRSGLPASGAIAPTSSEMRQYDAGPLGGRVWCQTYEYKVLKKGTLVACGWVDQWTVGTIVVNPAADEVGVAARLVAMRADIESKA